MRAGDVATLIVSDLPDPCVCQTRGSLLRDGIQMMILGLQNA